MYGPGCQQLMGPHTFFIFGRHPTNRNPNSWFRTFFLLASSCVNASWVRIMIFFSRWVRIIYGPRCQPHMGPHILYLANPKPKPQHMGPHIFPPSQLACQRVMGPYYGSMCMSTACSNAAVVEKLLYVVSLLLSCSSSRCASYKACTETTPRQRVLQIFLNIQYICLQIQWLTSDYLSFIQYQAFQV
jgi:hypothetical protein